MGWEGKDGEDERENFSTVQQHSGYLFDDVFSGGECNLDGTLGNWQEEVLHCLLNSRLDTLLQLRVLLQEEDLGEGGGGGESFWRKKEEEGNRGFALRSCTLLASIHHCLDCKWPISPHLSVYGRFFANYVTKWNQEI